MSEPLGSLVNLAHQTHEGADRRRVGEGSNHHERNRKGLLDGVVTRRDVPITDSRYRRHNEVESRHVLLVHWSILVAVLSHPGGRVEILESCDKNPATGE